MITARCIFSFVFLVYANLIIGQAYTPKTLHHLGDSFGAAINVGTNDAFGLNLETNNTNRLRFNEAGRMFSGTLTDAILVASDSARLEGAGGKLDITSGFSRLYAGATIGYQLNNSTLAHSMVVGDNLSAAWQVTISGGNTHFLANSTNGAEVTEVGSTATGASLKLNATPADSTTQTLVGLSSDIAKEITLFEQLATQTAADTIISLPARQNVVLANLAGGAFTTTIPNPAAAYKGIVIEFVRINGNFTTDVYTVTTVAGSNGFYNGNAAANTITFQSSTTASGRVRCIQNGGSYFWAVIN